MAYILAHDLGTSGNKATLYDESGQLVASRVASYPTRFFNGNWAEQHPDDWWQAVCRSTTELLAHAPKGDIAAVSFSGHMMGCLPVDASGRPLRPHILYCDQRSQAQEDVIRSRIDPWTFYTTTGHRPSASYTLEKVMWLKENEPDVYAAAHAILNAKDYIVFLLTGEIATDFSDAGGTELFDINTMKWSDAIADACGIDLEKFPAAYESSHIVGTVTRGAAEKTGIPEGTPVCCGAGDGCAAGVGAGSVVPGSTYTCIGSSAWVGATSESPMYDKEMRFPVFPHAVPGLYHSCGAMQTAGASFSWAAREIFGTAYPHHADDPYAEMEQQIDNAGPGAHGIIFLPYLMGERAPWWDNDAKACFLGIRQETVRGDLLRAVEEGVSYNLRIILEAYREYLDVQEMTFVGGAAKSPVWSSILAGVFGMPVVKPANIEECASLGAALIGGVGAGLFADYAAALRIAAPKAVFEPDPEARRVYDDRFSVFTKSYYALKDLFPLL